MAAGYAVLGEHAMDDYCERMAQEAKAASRQIAQLPGSIKDRWLEHCACELINQQHEILHANELDLAQAIHFARTAAQVDRLRLDPPRIQAMADGMRAVAALPNPVGRVLDGGVRPNGMEVRKVAVPLGVLFFIYESRPNVTMDAAALAIKSGN